MRSRVRLFRTNSFAVSWSKCTNSKHWNASMAWESYGLCMKICTVMCPNRASHHYFADTNGIAIRQPNVLYARTTTLLHTSHPLSAHHVECVSVSQRTLIVAQLMDEAGELQRRHLRVFRKFGIMVRGVWCFEVVLTAHFSSRLCTPQCMLAFNPTRMD